MTDIQTLIRMAPSMSIADIEAHFQERDAVVVRMRDEMKLLTPFWELKWRQFQVDHAGAPGLGQAVGANLSGELSLGSRQV